MNKPAVASPIETEVALGRLQSVVDEAGSVLMRTAFSLGIREAKDFSCAILTRRGDTVVQSRQSIPMFIGTLTYAARHLLDAFPADTWNEGDVVAVNDPWHSTGHLFDVTLLRPIFVDGVLTAFGAVVGHLSDIGGRGFSLGSSDVYEEGFQIPPTKVVVANRADATFRSLLGANVRGAEQVLGDFDAMQGALLVTEPRVGEIAADLSRERLLAVFDDLEARSEAFMRTAIQALPDGTYSSSFVSEPVLDSTYRLELSLVVDGDSVAVDFTGSSAQVDAAINSTLPYTNAYVIYALKCLLAPDVQFTSGLARPVSVLAPEGTVVNRSFPAPGVARNLVGQFIPTMIFEALVGVVPSLAESGAPRPSCRITGRDQSTGREFSAPFFVMGGMGARPNKDGISCIAFPTNTESVPVEIIEATTPFLVESKELVADSGGAGRFRGGLGQRVVIRCLASRARAFVVAQRLLTAPVGSAGGGPGATAVLLKNGRRITHLAAPVELSAGDTLTVQSAGGAGYGDPRARPVELVVADLNAGYVSKRAARVGYGHELP